jgi:hypothetical protein
MLIENKRWSGSHPFGTTCICDHREYGPPLPGVLHVVQLGTGSPIPGGATWSTAGYGVRVSVALHVVLGAVLQIAQVCQGGHHLAMLPILPIVLLDVEPAASVQGAGVGSTPGVLHVLLLGLGSPGPGRAHAARQAMVSGSEEPLMLCQVL